jgi:NTP-dependent ternary conflict system VMAP-like protein/effector-associated domain 2 (EAD2)-containing protein
MSQHLRISTDLVDVLASLPLMQQPEPRQQFMRQLRQQLDHRVDQRVELRDHPEPRRQCREIVDGCFPAPPMLWVVVEVVELFVPAAIQLRRLQRLLHERDVVDVLAEEDWLELRDRLQEIYPQDSGRLYQRATEHQLAAPPPWCEQAWDMFVHLSGQNAPASGLPPGMVFLLLLEQEVDSATAGLLRRRNQRMATELAVTAQLDRRRAVMNTGGDQPFERYVYLVIQVEPDQEPAGADPPERYLVSHYRQWYGGTGWHSQLRDRIQEVSGAELEDVVERVIEQMEEEWAGRREEVVIEFVLPIHLLNQDVAWWRKERARPELGWPEKVLAMDYPVVVRSLDRLREPRWHHAWRRRWERLQADPARSRLYRSQGGTDPTQLEAALASDLRWASLLLSEPPTMDASGDRTGLREVMTALRAGVPVIFWHRTEPTSDALWEDVHDMTADGQISRLPRHVRAARLAALRVDPDRRSGHRGRHLAVLWDDPDRMPEQLDRAGGSTREGS